MIEPQPLYSRKSSIITNVGSSQLQQKVNTLEKEIEQLNKIILEKDQIFNTIMLAYDAAKYKNNQLATAIEYHLKQFQSNYKANDQINPQFLVQQTEQIKRLAEIVLTDLQKILNVPWDNQSCTLQTNKILSIVKGLAEDTEQNNNSLDQKENKKIYQVPVEMVVIQNLFQPNQQEDLSPTKSYVYEVPVQFYSIQEIPVQLGEKEIDEIEVVELQRKIFQITVQMDQIYEIPGLLDQFTQNQNGENKSQDYIFEVVKNDNLISQHQKLLNQITHLKQQISLLKQQLSQEKEKIDLQPIRIIQMVQIPVQLEPFQLNLIEKQRTSLDVQIQTDHNEQPVIKDFEKQIILREIPIQVFVQKIIQIPKDVVIQKIVQQTKIQLVQVPFELLIEKTIFVQVQKLIPVLVPIIKQVPIEVQILSQPLLIQHKVPIFIPIIKEIPIQIYIPVEKEVIKQVKNLVEVPVIVYLQLEKAENNSFSQQQKSINVCNAKLGQQSNFIQQQSNFIQHENCKVVQVPTEILIEKAVQVEKIVQRRVQKQIIVQKVIQVPVQKIVEIQKIVEKEVIKYVIKQIPIQCIIQSPIKIQQQILNITQKSQQEDLQICLDCREQYVQTQATQNNTIAINTNPLQPTVLIYELPIELQLLGNQQRQRQIEFKNQQEINYIQQKYQNDVRLLNDQIDQMRRLMDQKQVEFESLQQQKQLYSLNIEDLENQQKNQMQMHSKQVEAMRQIIEKLVTQIKQKAIFIQNLQRQLQNKPDVKQMSTSYQIPTLNKQLVEKEIQTEQIDLFKCIQFIEIPVEIQVYQQITLQKLQNHQNQQVLENQQAKNKTDQDYCKLKKIQQEILHWQQALNKSQLQQKQFVQNSKPVQIIQQYRDSEFNDQIEQNVTYQPQIYEVPIEMNLFVQSSDAQVQTDFEQYKKIEHCIYEVPIEMMQISEYQSIQQQQRQAIRDQEGQKRSFDNQNNEQGTQQLKNQFIKQKEGKVKQTIIDQIFYNILVTGVKVDDETLTRSIQTQPITLQIVKQFQINQIFQISQDKKSNAFLKFSIFHDIENIAIPPIQEHNSPQQRPKQRQKKLQNQILRLGSDITVNFQNNSQVQSLTPRGLFASHSSYQKFQKFPSPQINNISLIKKDSFSQGRLFGSLDIRQEILSRGEDPIASLRLQNKKLTGFQQQQSSDGDIHNTSREMIIEQSQTIVSQDINRIHTPNLQPHDLNFSENAKFQQNKYQIQQEQRNYFEQNQLLNTKIGKLEKEIDDYREEINQLEHHLSKLEENYQNSIEQLEKQLDDVKKQKQSYELKIEEYKNVIEQNQYIKNQLRNQNQFLAQNFQRLKEETQINERQTNKQIERLQNLTLDKQNQIKELKIQTENIKNYYEQQASQLKQYLASNKEQIQKLYEQLKYKNQKIEELQESLQQLRKNIDLMKHLQDDNSNNYEKQLERIRCDFDYYKRQKQQVLEELKAEVQRINIQNINEKTKTKQYQDLIDQLQRNLQEMKSQNQKLQQIKIQTDQNYITYMKQLKEQVEQLKIQIVDRDEAIIKLNHKISNLQLKANKQSIKVQYIQAIIQNNNDSRLIELQQYSKRLQSIILKYEKKLIKNIHTIQQLQEKLCEYLNDALEKQQQAENLHLKLISCQNRINELLLEKYNLQLQNKKHTKSIQEAEKKMKLLGKKLIEVARNRANYDSYDEDEYQV